MSSGAFTSTFYETNAGNICAIRVQPETLTLTLGGTANAAPSGPADQEASAISQGSRRGIGVNARRVRLRWTGTVPDGYDGDGIVTVPILQPTLYNSLTRGTTGTYLGGAVEVAGRTPEYVN